MTQLNRNYKGKMYKKEIKNNSDYNDNITCIVLISAAYMYCTYYYILAHSQSTHTSLWLSLGTAPCTVLTHIYAWSFASLDANGSGPDRGGGTGTGAGTCSLAHWTDSHCCCVVINVYVCVCVCVLCAVRIDAAIIQINFETKACRLFVSFRNVTKQLLAARSCVVRRN